MAVADKVSHAPWLAELAGELIAMLDFPANWNSYGAPQISPCALGYVLAVVHETMDAHSIKPIALPSPSGGVQLEWHQRGVDFEVEVLPSGELSMYFGIRVKGEENRNEHELELEGPLEDLAAPIREHIQKYLTTYN